MRKAAKQRNHIVRDVLLVVGSIAAAIILSQMGFFAAAIDATASLGLLRTFIAGLFFTSVFTTAPAIAALAEISATESIYLTALVGGFGALCGDLLLFWFVRDSVAVDIRSMIGKNTGKRFFKKYALLQWIAPVIGAVIIASPLPDELGLTLLGISRINTLTLIPVSLVMNTLGILAIAFAASVL